MLFESSRKEEKNRIEEHTLLVVLFSFLYHCQMWDICLTWKHPFRRPCHPRLTCHCFFWPAPSLHHYLFCHVPHIWRSTLLFLVGVGGKSNPWLDTGCLGGWYGTDVDRWIFPGGFNPVWVQPDHAVGQSSSNHFKSSTLNSHWLPSLKIGWESVGVDHSLTCKYIFKSFRLKSGKKGFRCASISTS